MSTLLTLPSLKRWLIELNLELDRVLSCVYAWDDRKTLNDIEFYVVVLEDRRFFQHDGLDRKSVLREIWRACTLRRHGGASTIDMQFVRTVTGRYERTLKRKMREVLISRLLRYHVSKHAVLRSYLDIAYFGTGLSGVYSVADSLFDCAPSQLSGKDAAFVASMLVSPRPRMPSQEWFVKVLARAEYALSVGSGLEESFQKIGMR
ncbi:biosynthetic peptidoglycan transglycosylase [Aureimonas sp. N4]|uniref:biosynthetic peptidoglycan transglycosylase n=1 Tax=Aureimonas sp. N4 TaxID=1638165 RepID=UPI0009E89F96